MSLRPAKGCLVRPSLKNKTPTGTNENNCACVWIPSTKPPFPSPPGAFKSLDKNGTGQIRVNIQEVRSLLWAGAQLCVPAPPTLFAQQALGEVSGSPGLSLTRAFLFQWLQLTMYS